MMQDSGEVTIHQPPPGVFLLPAVNQILKERWHLWMWVIAAVVKEEGICVVDAEGGHELGRHLGPAVHHHSNDCSQGGFQSLWVHLQRLLLQWLGEVLRRFRVGVLQVFHTLIPVVVVVSVLDNVKNSHHCVHEIVNGKGLVGHDGRGYVCMRR